MSQPLTVAQALLISKLPDGLYQPGDVLDKKGLSKLLQKAIEEHPDKYAEISLALTQLGRDVAAAKGGASFSISDLAQTPRAKVRRLRLKQLLKEKLDNSDPKQQAKIVVDTVMKEMDQDREEIYEDAVAMGHPLADQLAGAGRGNKSSLASLVGSDNLYEDNSGGAVPLYVYRSFSQGLTPGQFLASTFGARRGVTAAKLSVASSGYLSKVLQQAAHRLVVEAEDDDSTIGKGLPVETDDKENDGALLARDTGPYERNTIITPKIRNHLKRLGVNDILVRSPIASGTPNGGVYARDIGMREYGRLPQVGEHPGSASAAALSESVTQATLCLAKGTLVRMADDSVKCIEDVQIGDMVWGSDTKGNLRPVRVLALHNNGLRECYTTRFCFPYRKDAVELVSTLDHNILASRAVSGQLEESQNFVPQVMPVGTVSRRFYAVPSSTVQSDAWTEGPCADLAFVVGMLLGDGCDTESVIKKGGGVHLSCADASLARYTSRLLRQWGMRLSRHKGSPCYWRVSVKSPRIDYRSWPLAAVIGLSRGLWSSDGGGFGVDGKPHMTMGLTSETLLEQVKWLLRHRLCVHVGKTYKSEIGRKRPIFSFSITHITNVRKLGELLRLPGQRGLRIAGLLESYCLRSEKKRYYLKRVSQDNAGMLPTYDITVDHPDHLFLLANGLIVSNSSKHGGGVAGQSAHLNAFDLIDKTVNPPKERRDRATHTSVDGRVDKIIDAPQGGKYVQVDGNQHYVPQGVDVMVKVGDVVEAGDQLSDGIVDHVAVAQHKGVGEGRRYLVKAFTQALGKAGFNPARRNVELVARGLIDRVRMTDEYGDYLPDDVVPYHRLEAMYKAREDARESPPEASLNRYLEKPVLHYSIGTKLRPSVVATLRKFNVENVSTHHEPPPFETEVVRGIDLLTTDEDWMTRHLGSNLQKGLLEAAWRGRESDTDSTSYVGARATVVDFNREGKVRMAPETPAVTSVPSTTTVQPAGKPIDASSNIVPAREEAEPENSKGFKLFPGLSFKRPGQ